MCGGSAGQLMSGVTNTLSDALGGGGGSPRSGANDPQAAANSEQARAIAGKVDTEGTTEFGQGETQYNADAALRDASAGDITGARSTLDTAGTNLDTAGGTLDTAERGLDTAGQDVAALRAKANDPNAVEAARTRSIADVASAYQGAKANTERTLAAQGVNPGDPAARAGSNAGNVNLAAAEVGAGNTGALARETYQTGLQKDVAGAQESLGVARGQVGSERTGVAQTRGAIAQGQAGIAGEESTIGQRGLTAEQLGTNAQTNAISGLSSLAATQTAASTAQQGQQQERSGLLGFLAKGGKVPLSRGFGVARIPSPRLLQPPRLGLRADSGGVEDPPRFGIQRETPQMRGTDGALRSTDAGPAEGHITGPGGETDDKIPALLSHGEYVNPAFVGANLGIHTLDGIVEIARQSDAGDPHARQTAGKLIQTVAGFGIRPPSRVAGQAPMMAAPGPLRPRGPGSPPSAGAPKAASGGFGIRADDGGDVTDNGDATQPAMTPTAPPAPGINWNKAASNVPSIQLGGRGQSPGQQVKGAIRGLAHNPAAIAKGVAALVPLLSRGGGVRALGASLGG